MSQYFKDNYEQDHDDRTYLFGLQQKHCLIMINCILDRAEKINSKKGKLFTFNTEFPLSIKEWINNHDASSKQINALEKIMKKFRIKYDNEKREGIEDLWISDQFEHRNQDALFGTSVF